MLLHGLCRYMRLSERQTLSAPLVSLQTICLRSGSYRSVVASRRHGFCETALHTTCLPQQTVSCCSTALHLTFCSPAGLRPSVAASQLLPAAVNRLHLYRSYSPRISSFGGSTGYFPLKQPLQIGSPSTICGSLSMPRYARLSAPISSHTSSLERL